MKYIKLSFKNFLFDRSSNALSVLLIAVSFCLIVLVVHLKEQAENDIKRQIQRTDMVIGAKGSPLQLILSAIFHIDKPTGNIKVSEAQKIMKHPLVAQAIPLNYGDNVEGFRLVGTTSKYAELYDMQLKKGRAWEQYFEVTVGSEVANALHLNIGDTLISSHGLAGQLEAHASNPLIVTGIYSASGSPLDRLILCDLHTIWEMHPSHEGEEHAHSNHSAQEEDHNHDNDSYTAVLIKFRNLAGMMQLPRTVNEQTNMQAAVPSFEVDRLFKLIGNGATALTLTGFIILGLATISLFIQMYRSFRQRRYEMALMRIYGAQPIQVVSVIVFEVLWIVSSGLLLGWLFSKLSHLVFSVYSLTPLLANMPWRWLTSTELELSILVLLIGLISAGLPMWQAYRLELSKILSSKN